MISILIAARNEEDTILTCLQSIERLDFPTNKFEVWIGDDASEDHTYAQVAKFIEGKTHFHLIRINKTLGQARGKANVLAQLAQHATGDYFLITDADITVPANWVTIMLDSCPSGVGIVTGVTVPKAWNTWTALQAMEWVYVLFIIHILAKQHIPVTAMGNNMLVTRQSYQATGGYEQIPFSITEDLQLFREVLSLGYGFRQLYTPQAMAVTLPMLTFTEWLQQRRRWTYGALQLKGITRVLLFSPLLCLVLLLVFSFIYPGVILISCPALLFLQILFLGLGITRLRLFRLYPYMGLFPFYFYFSILVTLTYYCLPAKTIWKGRVYE